jgi:hypothetical protein
VSIVNALFCLRITDQPTGDERPCFILKDTFVLTAEECRSAVHFSVF